MTAVGALSNELGVRRRVLGVCSIVLAKHVIEDEGGGDSSCAGAASACTSTILDTLASTSMGSDLPLSLAFFWFRATLFVSTVLVAAI